MRAARMHGYNQPLVLEGVKVPDMAADEVLIKVNGDRNVPYGHSTLRWLF